MTHGVNHPPAARTASVSSTGPRAYRGSRRRWPSSGDVVPAASRGATAGGGHGDQQQPSQDLADRASMGPRPMGPRRLPRHLGDGGGLGASMGPRPMGPWRPTPCRATVGLRLLQWGHGPWGRGNMRTSTDQYEEIQLQWGHGPWGPWRRGDGNHTDDWCAPQWGHGPWGRGDGRGLPGARLWSSFNGATAHGAVETSGPARAGPHRGCFNGATAHGAVETIKQIGG